MPKTFRPWQPDQTTLLPPSPREWLAEDHQVYFLLDLVDELDLSEILIPAPLAVTPLFFSEATMAKIPEPEEALELSDGEGTEETTGTLG